MFKIRLVINSDRQQGIQVSKSPNVTVYHLDGCTHKIVISPPFKMAAKSSFSFQMKQQFWSVTYTDVMTNW